MTTRPRRWHNPFRGIVSHFRTTLGAGILVMLPIAITTIILKFFFDLLDQPLRPVLELIPGLRIPGLGLAFLLVLVYLAGLITALAVGRRLFETGHHIVEAIPVVKSIYSAARIAVQLLSAPKDESFSGVVLIDFPSRGLKSIGLVTARTKAQDGDEMLAVFVGTPPTPSTGNLVFVAAKDATPTQMNVDDAIKIILSTGVLAKVVYRPPPSQNRA